MLNANAGIYQMLTRNRERYKAGRAELVKAGGHAGDLAYIDRALAMLQETIDRIEKQQKAPG